MNGLFSFEGRATRSEWWGVAILAIVLEAVIRVVAHGDDFVSAIAFITTIPLLWMVLATNTRWHDLDWSGWLTLVLLIPIVDVIALVFLAFVPGTPGQNEYGSRSGQ